MSGKKTFMPSYEALPFIAKCRASGGRFILENDAEEPVEDLKQATQVHFPENSCAFKLDQVAFGGKHSLKSVLYCLENETLGQMQYFRKSMAEKIPALPNTDKELLLRELEKLAATPEANASSAENTAAANFSLHDSRKHALESEADEAEPQKKKLAVADLSSSERQWMSDFSKNERTVENYCAMLHTRNVRLKPLIAYIANSWNTRIRMSELPQVQKAFQKQLAAENASRAATAVKSEPTADISSAMSTFARVAAGATNLSLPAADTEPKLAPKAAAQVPRSSLPIIVVPTGPKSLINPYNARLFLEGKDFDLKPTEQYLAAGEPLPSLADITIHRKLDHGRTKPYRVCFMPQQITDWKRVVAVFASGEPWQFEQHYQWKDPAVLFNNACGFHLKEFRTPTLPLISKLNVHVLDLHYGITKHQNTAMLKKKFWETLDKWMVSKGRSFD